MIVSPPTPETLLRAARGLPSAPLILAKVSKMLADPDSDLESLTLLLKRDPGLTACIVRISNSAVYGYAEPCNSLEAAVTRVGFTELYRLVGFAATAQISPQRLGLFGVSGAQFRENALLTALLMEGLAPLAGVDGPTAYTAGLLRSIGKIALDRLVSADCDLDYELHGTGPLSEWEAVAVGMTNGEAASIVLKNWGFAPEAIETISLHYNPPYSHQLACLLNLAAGRAERCGHGWPGERYYWEDWQARLTAARIDEAGLEEAMRTALEKFGPVRAAVA